MPNIGWLGNLEVADDQVRHNLVSEWQAKSELKQRKKEGEVTKQKYESDADLGQQKIDYNIEALDENRSQWSDQLSQWDYEKKRDIAKWVIDVTSQLQNEEDKEKLLRNPYTVELFNDLEWPLPGTSVGEEEDLGDEAVNALEAGETLPGMTMEETKKAAGVYIAPLKVAASDVKGAEEDIPLWEKWVPGRQRHQRDYDMIRGQRKKQFGLGQLLNSGKNDGADPLGFRKE